MLKTLSFRNAKRQIEKYIIYWISLSLAIALIYSFNALGFSEVMRELSKIASKIAASNNEYTFAYMIIQFSIIIVFVLGWFVDYMTTFMLRKRSQEISTYMILGIEKRQISKMLFTENLFIGSSALITGIFFGTFISKILEALVLHLTYSQYSLSPGLSLQAVGMTILYFCFIYLVALLKNKRKINKMKLIELLYYDKYNETVIIRRKKINIILFFVSLLCGCSGIYLFSMPNNNLNDIVLGLLLTIIFFLFLFKGLAAAAQKFFEKKINWKYQKSHLLLYRLLFSKINTVSIVLSIISILFTVSIVCIGIANTSYTAMKTETSLQAFDISILHMNESYDFSKYKKYLSETADIKQEHSYTLYTNHNTILMDVRNKTLFHHLLESNYLLKFNREFNPKDFIFKENRFDTFMKYSDYCILRKMLGLHEVEMGNNNFIIHCMPYLFETYTNYFSNNNQLTIANKDLTCANIYTETFSQYNGYGNGQDYLIIIPDDLTETMDILYSLYAAIVNQPLDRKYMNDFENYFNTLKSLHLDSAIIISVNDEGKSLLSSPNIDYLDGKYATQISSSSIFSILYFFYFALIVCIIGTVIPAAQLLTENNNTIKHFKLLQTLGMDTSALLSILKKYVFLYFSFPLFPAIIFGGILVFAFCHTLIFAFEVPVFSSISAIIVQIIGITLAIFLSIYSIYIFITYKILKKEILFSK